MSLNTANDAYPFTAEPVLRSPLEVARENQSWAACTGEGEAEAIKALLIAEEGAAASMLSKMAWHRRLIAEIEAADDPHAKFKIAEHNEGIARCQAALAALAPVQGRAA